MHKLTSQEIRRAERYSRDHIDLRYILQESVVVSSPQMDGMPHGYSTSDPCFSNATILYEAKKKLELIHRTAAQAAGPELMTYLLEYIDHPMTVQDLYDMGMPETISRNQFIHIVKKYYRLLLPHIPDHYISN